MPKKKINPFWAFLMDYKRDNKIESIDEAKAKADVIWRSMTEAEKKMYAGRSKQSQASNEAPLTPIEIRDKEEILFKQKMLEDITAELNIARKYNKLSSSKFFIIHINSFCSDHQRNRTYPCEIGISSFSLQSGVSKDDVYHSFIYPGSLPPGYSGQAKIISEQTHQLSWENSNLDNQQEVFEEVIDFLSQRSQGSQKLPKLYAIREKELEIVKNVLDTWCDDFDPKISFTVYNAQTLFTLLHKNIIENSPCSSEALCYREFEKDVHQYAPKIACEYHEESECPVYCSRSIAIRYGYIICQTCSPSLGIQLVSGFHIPSNMKQAVIESKKTFKYRAVDSCSTERDTEDTCTVRDDSSDVDTLVSIGRNSTYIEDSASSIYFPEYDDMAQNVSSDIRTGGRSGFSRKPAALPSTVDRVFSNLTLSQDSLGRRNNEWPSLRGRGGGAIPRTKGRGQPFKNK